MARGAAKAQAVNFRWRTVLLGSGARGDKAPFGSEEVQAPSAQASQGAVSTPVGVGCASTPSTHVLYSELQMWLQWGAAFGTSWSGRGER